MKKLLLTTLLTLTTSAHSAVDVVFGGWSKHFNATKYGEYNESHNALGVEYHKNGISYGYMSFKDSYNSNAYQFSLGQYLNTDDYNISYRINIASRSIVSEDTHVKYTANGVVRNVNVEKYRGIIFYPSLSLSKELYKGFGASISLIPNPLNISSSVVFLNFSYLLPL